MRVGDILQTESEESCTTYNMLKVYFVKKTKSLGRR